MRFLESIIANSYVVNKIRNQVVEVFIINLRYIFERPSPGFEIIITAGNDVK